MDRYPVFARRRVRNIIVFAAASICALIALFRLQTDSQVFRDGVAFAFPESWNDRWRDHSATVARIRAMIPGHEKEYPQNQWQAMRSTTIDSLHHLADCLEAHSCTRKEKQVIILGGMHFGSSQSGSTGGEDIWAASIVDILRAENYTLLYAYSIAESYSLYRGLPDEMVPLVFIDAMQVKDCVASGARAPAAAAVPAKSDDKEAEAPCHFFKRTKFPDGIPVWKVRAFHFWLGQNHPLKGWTISPEDFQDWGGGNYYLGYHIPHCIGRKASPVKLPRAFILGKNPDYFKDGQYAWPRGILAKISDEVSLDGERLTFVGGSGNAQQDLPEPGIVNLGLLNRTQWQEELSKSIALVGIGRPVLSPSPYDSLCLGVPFINPILERDSRFPYDKARWNSQHNALKELDPPYVYNVWKDDHEGFRAAVHAALHNHIEPYIPPWATREAMRERTLRLVEGNWRAEAEAQILRGGSKGWNFGPDHADFNGLML